jgi:hypothetical protein
MAASKPGAVQTVRRSMSVVHVVHAATQSTSTRSTQHVVHAVHLVQPEVRSVPWRGGRSALARVTFATRVRHRCVAKGHLPDPHSRGVVSLIYGSRTVHRAAPGLTARSAKALAARTAHRPADVDRSIADLVASPGVGAA